MFEVKPFPPKTLSWWHMQKKLIDMNPVYQRKSLIWPKKDKQFLFNSILNNYDIPKIYIADFTYVNTPLNEKKLPYAVIDGKQRFEAIFDFFDGKITLEDEFQFVDDTSLSLGGLGYKELKTTYPEVASKFDNFGLSVMSVITDEEGKINELFIRLNHSKPLVGAEKRNAFPGEFSKTVRELVNHEFFKNKINFKTTRMQDHNTVAKLLLIEFRGKFVDTKKKHLDQFARDFQKDIVLSENKDITQSVNGVISTLTDMDEIFIEKDPLLSSQGPLAVYFWLIKNHQKQKTFIREFLVKFEKEVKSNRIRKEEKDEDLTEYYVMHRSTNDEKSLATRYRILDERFKNFIEKEKNLKLL